MREAAELIEHGITVGGKTLKDHLEAVDHHDALPWMREAAARGAPVGDDVVRELHRRIAARSEPRIAGVYSPHPRRIAGSPVVVPNPLEIPDLMRESGAWLAEAPPASEAAFEAHFRLTALHLFGDGDGNGRTARLLMNLLLIRQGFPPVAVRPQDRARCLDALERGSLAGDLAPFQTVVHERTDETLAGYLAALGIA